MQIHFIGVIHVKKIKKIDPKNAQSVFAFACPCVGHCFSGCANDLHFLSLETIGLPGMQTVNYN